MPLKNCTPPNNFPTLSYATEPPLPIQLHAAEPYSCCKILRYKTNQNYTIIRNRTPQYHLSNPIPRIRTSLPNKFYAAESSPTQFYIAEHPYPILRTRTLFLPKFYTSGHVFRPTSVYPLVSRHPFVPNSTPQDPSSLTGGPQP